MIEKMRQWIWRHPSILLFVFSLLSDSLLSQARAAAFLLSRTSCRIQYHTNIMRGVSACLALAALVPATVHGFGVSNPDVRQSVAKCQGDTTSNTWTEGLKNFGKLALSAGVAATLSFNQPALAVSSDAGASTASNAKITTGGASTLQSGRTIAITRGVNLDNSNFAGENLKGVAFQQSIVRNSNFKGCNLVGSSFFDATVDGSNFSDADMSLSNIEMAQFNRANLHNTVMREVYVSGATLFEGVKDIEGSDWTDTVRTSLSSLEPLLSNCVS
jgi:uncharacterized protein YjbI with pentapeptide repeats